jgi:hypothetical protein
MRNQINDGSEGVHLVHQLAIRTFLFTDLLTGSWRTGSLLNPNSSMEILLGSLVGD